MARRKARAAVKIRRRYRRRQAEVRSSEWTVPITFSIVGVQKAATSTLFRMLVEHPHVAGGPEKEMRRFLHPPESRSDVADYARPADGPHVTTAGDATPAYFYWPGALEGLRDYDPTIPLIVSLRDPIERAMSQWAMERRKDQPFPDLREATERFGTCPADELPQPRRKTSLFARGRYGEQLRRGLELFPRELWLVVDFRDVVERPHDTLDLVTDHLGLERFEVYPTLRQRNATSRDNTGPPMTRDQLSRLVDHYLPDLALLEELSGLDVSSWSTSRVGRGALDLDDFHLSLMTRLGLTGAEPQRRSSNS